VPVDSVVTDMRVQFYWDAKPCPSASIARRVESSYFNFRVWNCLTSDSKGIMIFFINLIFMEPCIVIWLVAMTNKMQLSNGIYYSTVH